MTTAGIAARHVILIGVATTDSGDSACDGEGLIFGTVNIYSIGNARGEGRSANRHVAESLGRGMRNHSITGGIFNINNSAGG